MYAFMSLSCFVNLHNVQLCFVHKCWLTLQEHFDDAQFESHRVDGMRKLRPDAVPMIFDDNPPASAATDSNKSKCFCMYKTTNSIKMAVFVFSPEELLKVI